MVYTHCVLVRSTARYTTHTSKEKDCEVDSEDEEDNFLLYMSIAGNLQLTTVPLFTQNHVVFAGRCTSLSEALLPILPSFAVQRLRKEGRRTE